MFYIKTIKNIKSNLKMLHEQRIQQTNWIADLDKRLQKLHQGLCNLSDEVGDIYEKELKKTPKGKKSCK